MAWRCSSITELLLAVALAGCSAIEQRSALDAEAPLAEAGLPERLLVESGGAYKFADATFCDCVYVGGAAEDAALQRLRAERIAEREWIMSRNPSYVGAADRTAWSAWKPEGLDLAPAAAAGR